MANNNYKAIKLDIKDGVATVELDRENKANALNGAMWDDIKNAFNALSIDKTVRVVVITAAGKLFCSGIDLNFFAEQSSTLNDPCEGRTHENLYQFILGLQSSFSAIESCKKPVIAAVQGGCIGGGVDLISACDMRYCSVDAYFSIKEVDLAITADVGSLQRLPRMISDGHLRELSYTGRNIDSTEASRLGLVNQVFTDKKALLAGVNKIAQEISEKSPITIRGIKDVLNYTREHTTDESLQYVALRNTSMLLSADLEEAMMAHQEKENPFIKIDLGSFNVKLQNLAF